MVANTANDRRAIEALKSFSQQGSASLYDIELKRPQQNIPSATFRVSPRSLISDRNASLERLVKSPHPYLVALGNRGCGKSLHAAAAVRWIAEDTKTFGPKAFPALIDLSALTRRVHTLVGRKSALCNAMSEADASAIIRHVIGVLIAGAISESLCATRGLRNGLIFKERELSTLDSLLEKALAREGGGQIKAAIEAVTSSTIRAVEAKGKASLDVIFELADLDLEGEVRAAQAKSSSGEVVLNIELNPILSLLAAKVIDQEARLHLFLDEFSEIETELLDDFVNVIKDFCSRLKDRLNIRLFAYFGDRRWGRINGFDRAPPVHIGMYANPNTALTLEVTDLRGSEFVEDMIDIRLRALKLGRVDSFGLTEEIYHLIARMSGGSPRRFGEMIERSEAHIHIPLDFKTLVVAGVDYWAWQLRNATDTIERVDAFDGQWRDYIRETLLPEFSRVMLEEMRSDNGIRLHGKRVMVLDDVLLECLQPFFARSLLVVLGTDFNAQSGRRVYLCGVNDGVRLYFLLAGQDRWPIEEKKRDGLTEIYRSLLDDDKKSGRLGATEANDLLGKALQAFAGSIGKFPEKRSA